MRFLFSIAYFVVELNIFTCQYYPIQRKSINSLFPGKCTARSEPNVSITICTVLRSKVFTVFGQNLPSPPTIM